MEPTEQTRTPTPTGLNYLELAKQQHAANKQAELGQMSFNRMVSPERGAKGAR